MVWFFLPTVRVRRLLPSSAKAMNRTLPLLLSLGLVGCYVVGPDYVRPKTQTPKHWRFTVAVAKETANLAWWKQLNDHVLDNLIEQALASNLDLTIAIAHVQQFMGVYGATRANLFPQIFAQANYERQQTSSQNIAELGAALFWELDIWGQLRRAKEAAYADLLAQEAVRDAVILTLVSAVAQTYITLVTLDKSLQITHQTVAVLDKANRIAKARFKQGFASEIEVSQSDSELERRRAQIPFFEQHIAQTEHALRLLLGRTPGSISRGLSLSELTLPVVPAGLPSELLARRPDIKQAEQHLIAANARIGVARGEFFPKIRLTGTIGQTSLELAQLFVPGANFWSVGSHLLGPIFTAGRIAGQVQAAEAAQRAALAGYQRAILSAFREFEDGLVASTKSNERQALQLRRVEALETYVRLSRIRYEEGYDTYLEVIDALRQHYEGQLEWAQARSDTFTALIQLYRVMGGGWTAAAYDTVRLPATKPAAWVP